MNEIKQTVLHDPENGKIGNCFSAVLSSLLHIPIEEVPMFTDIDTWRQDLNRWLRPKNLAYVQLENFKACAKDLGIQGCYHEIAGPSPRSIDTYHACVGLDGDILFDPHPDNSNLEEIHSEGIFIVLRPWEMK